MKKILKDIMDIIWGKPAKKSKPKRSRDKRGRYKKRSKK